MSADAGRRMRALLEIDARCPLRDVELRAVLRPGRTTAVIGPNGAGKSTLLGMVAGTVGAEGRVRLGERDLAGIPLHRRRVTHLAQDPVVFEHLSVLGNAAYGLRSQGVPRRAAEARARELLTRVGLDGLERRRASRLSGGQAQRLALVRALATDPDAVLLDEPFSALDVAARGELRELVARLLAGRTALMVTHDLLDVLALADDVLVLEQGRVRQLGERQEVLERPRSAFLARLLGASLTDGVATARGPRAEGMRAVGMRVQGVRTRGGLDLPARAVDECAPGERVHVLLDPARIALVPEEEMRTGDDAVIDAQIASLDRLGADLLVRCGELCARVPLREADAVGSLRPGAAVRLRVPSDAVRIYPVDRGDHPAP